MNAEALTATLAPIGEENVKEDFVWIMRIAAGVLLGSALCDLLKQVIV